MIKATNDNIWVTRDVAATQEGGIMIPDAAKPKVHRGKIITVGDLVSDKTISVDRTAIFNKSAGFEIAEAGIEYTVLKQMDVIGTDD